MKVGIIGAGNVGSATAFLMATAGIADEIVIINRTAKRALAEARDISHALPAMSNCSIKGGDYPDLANTDVAVITCGTKRTKIGQSRLDLLEENIAIYVEPLSKIAEFMPEGIIIVVTNPVDVLSGVALAITKFPAKRIIGSGTVLDSARFAVLLAEHFAVPVFDIHADVLGEHGDSQVPIWSTVTIRGQSIDAFATANGIEFSGETKLFLEERTRHAADEIIEGKDATCYGVAGAVAKICRAIKRNVGIILNVSTLHENFENIGDVFLSTPTLISPKGVAKILPLRVDAKESLSIRHSAGIIAKHSRIAMEILDGR
jgi:L-lactate dehydrogenase